MKTLLLKFCSDDRGATAIEYALIAGLISIAIVATLHQIGPMLTEKYSSVEAGFHN